MPLLLLWKDNYSTADAIQETDSIQVRANFFSGGLKSQLDISFEIGLFKFFFAIKLAKSQIWPTTNIKLRIDLIITRGGIACQSNYGTGIKSTSSEMWVIFMAKTKMKFILWCSYVKLSQVTLGFPESVYKRRCLKNELESHDTTLK